MSAFNWHTFWIRRSWANLQRLRLVWTIFNGGISNVLTSSALRRRNPPTTWASQEAFTWATLGPDNLIVMQTAHLGGLEQAAMVWVLSPHLLQHSPSPCIIGQSRTIYPKRWQRKHLVIRFERTLTLATVRPERTLRPLILSLRTLVGTSTIWVPPGPCLILFTTSPSSSVFRAASRSFTSSEESANGHMSLISSVVLSCRGVTDQAAQFRRHHLRVGSLLQLH